MDEILEEFGMKDSNTVSAPMDPGTATALMDLPLVNEDEIVSEACGDVDLSA